MIKANNERKAFLTDLFNFRCDGNAAGPCSCRAGSPAASGSSLRGVHHHAAAAQGALLLALRARPRLSGRALAACLTSPLSRPSLVRLWMTV